MVSFFFFKQKTAYEMRISDWSSDVCSSDLIKHRDRPAALGALPGLDQLVEHRPRQMRNHIAERTQRAEIGARIGLHVDCGEIRLAAIDGGKIFGGGHTCLP